MLIPLIEVVIASNSIWMVNIRRMSQSWWLIRFFRLIVQPKLSLEPYSSKLSCLKPIEDGFSLGKKAMDEN
jgi:hypothetical protein